MFKTFPEFTKLTSKDREEYEAYVKHFPPVSDIAFPSLMLWWDGVGETAVSVLNDNLVISYWIPGDEAHSGLSLIGSNKVDESICVIFDYLRDRGERPRLVNVPDFVIDNLRYPELFQFKTDGGDDEYIISLQRFARIEQLPQHMRISIRKFVRAFGEDALQVKNLNLRLEHNRQLLQDTSEQWPLKGVNNMTKRGREVFPLSVQKGPHLGMRCAGLFVHGELEAYCLYFHTNDKRYVTLAHARVNYEIPRIFGYMVHALANHLVGSGARFANIYSDNGSLKMRAIKIALRPDHFFRKYSIEPAPSR